MGGWFGRMTTPSSCSATWTTSSNTSDHVAIAGSGAAIPAAPGSRPPTRAESHMFVTPEGKEIFVVDGHTHFWDGSPENQRNIHGKQFIECFYGYHMALSPP